MRAVGVGVGNVVPVPPRITLNQGDIMDDLVTGGIVMAMMYGTYWLITNVVPFFM